MAIGIWFIGARGSVATTTTAGIAALKAGAAGNCGLVTELPEFDQVPLLPISDLVTGGHDISAVPITKRAQDLVAEGVFSQALLAAIGPQLEAADQRVCPGIVVGDESPRSAIARVQSDIRAFQEQHGLDTVVVVNVSSTEELLPANPVHESLSALEEALDEGRDVLAPSSLYAYAALDGGFPFIDFTPSTGARLPAIEQLAIDRGVPHAGNDGKTGETLVKTALAPMFLSRNLLIRSWSSFNVLGGGDGETLDNPGRKATKLQSKSQSLEASLGYSPEHRVSIEYVKDLGEWKTAWNHVTFEGFLGTSMRLQFTWEGCDSALAAPLVIDLVRLTAAARTSGIAGSLGSLAFFFKDPLGSDEHQLSRQFDELCRWAGELHTP